MSAVVAPPKIGSNERLTATLALSLIVHGMLVLGLGFALDDAAPVVPTLDVILSQTSTPLTPKQADFLAAAKAPSCARGAVVLQARHRADDRLLVRVGFTATRKIGGAVVRNRAKRRLREALKNAGETRERSDSKLD